MTLTDRQAERLAEIRRHTAQYAAVTKKAYEKKSKAAGIKAKCLDCSCWQRVEITNCTVETCPLWPYRPYQTPRSRKNSTNSEAL